MSRCDGPEFVFECMIGTVFSAIEDNHPPVRLMTDYAGQHAVDWRDSDSTGKKNDRLVRVQVEVEIPRRRLDLDQVSFFQLFVKQAADFSRWPIGKFGKCRDSFDGATVKLGIGGV